MKKLTWTRHDCEHFWLCIKTLLLENARLIPGHTCKHMDPLQTLFCFGMLGCGLPLQISFMNVSTSQINNRQLCRVIGLPCRTMWRLSMLHFLAKRRHSATRIATGIGLRFGRATRGSSKRKWDGGIYMWGRNMAQYFFVFLLWTTVAMLRAQMKWCGWKFVLKL